MGCVASASGTYFVTSIPLTTSERSPISPFPLRGSEISLKTSFLAPLVPFPPFPVAVPLPSADASALQSLSKTSSPWTALKAFVTQQKAQSSGNALKVKESCLQEKGIEEMIYL